MSKVTIVIEDTEDEVDFHMSFDPILKDMDTKSGALHLAKFILDVVKEWKKQVSENMAEEEVDNGL